MFRIVRTMIVFYTGMVIGHDLNIVPAISEGGGLFASSDERVSIAVMVLALIYVADTIYHRIAKR